MYIILICIIKYIYIHVFSVVVFDNLYQRFPIAEGQLRLVQTWVHYPNTPSIVLLRNPPPGTNRDKLEAYLEGLEIYTEDIIQSEDDDSITVNLTDPLGKREEERLLSVLFQSFYSMCSVVCVYTVLYL